MISNLTLALVLSLSNTAGNGAAQQTKGVAVAYPWAFTDGTHTSRMTVFDTVEHIAQRGGYAAASEDAARDGFRELRIPGPEEDNLPTKNELGRFGRRLNADLVLFGSVKWHTRSVWVGTGPKTISTATVTAYVFDVGRGDVVYRHADVQGRSDEKENGLKIAADILITPLVTAVSGGPATPREQRAAQIALSKAYTGWVHRSREGS